MHRIRTALVLLLLAGTAAACDSSPSDPLDPRTDLAPLLKGAEGGVAGLSLPGLVHAAVHRVYTEHGAAAARSLVADLRRVQEQSGPAATGSEPEMSPLRANAARMEELRIVLHVFGSPIVLRIIDAVQRDADRMEIALVEVEANGGAPERARELLSRVRSQIMTAQAETGRDALGALDAATQAAAAADALRLILDAARRLSDIDDLFNTAALRMRDDVGPDAAREALTEYNRLRRAGEGVVGSGDRQRAHSALKAIRDEQIRIVLDVLGAAAVQRLVDEATVAATALSAQLASARVGDVSRLERMSAAASDMLARAAASLDAADHAAALDLASHAAGLINAARLALSH
jgi:hypothetical protein